MTEFIHKVTKEDEGMEVREIMRTYFDFSATCAIKSSGKN